MFESKSLFSLAFVEAFQDVKVSRNLDQIEKLRKMAANGQEVYNLAFGQSPFPVPDFARQKLGQYADSNLYEAVQGIESLRQQIVKLHDVAKFGVTSENVIISPGCKEASWLLMSILSDKIPIFLCSPTWVAYESQVKSARKNLYWVDTKFDENFNLTQQSIETAVEKAKIEGNFHAEDPDLEFAGLVILVEPCNPTGRCHTESELENLAEIFKKHKLMVLSDEIYAQLCFDQKTQVMKKTIFEFYPEGTIISSGFSKWASLGGWRIGYEIYPNTTVMKNILARLKAAASFSYSCVTSPVQLACRDLLIDVYENKNDAWIFKSSVILCCLSEWIKNELKQIGVPATRSYSGFYLMPDFEILRHKFKTGTELTDQLLADTGISMVECGPCFGRAKEELTTRLCYIDLDGAEALRKFDEFRKLGDEYIDMTPREYLHKYYQNYEEFIGMVAPKMVVCIGKLCQWVKRQEGKI